MIDVYELIRIKENEMIQVRKEIDALHLVAPMLLDSGEVQGLEPNAHIEVETSSLEGQVIQEIHPRDETSMEPTETLPEPAPTKRGILREWFGHAAGE